MSRIDKKKINGFTMVELLCAIVILGLLSVLGIKSLSNMMDKANESKLLQQEKTLTMAAESYGQTNRSKLPRTVGEKIIIPISDLRNAKFLKEDIKNEKGESCMAKSYVVVLKSSKNDYEYTTYLVCGDDDPPTDAETKPDIDIYFTDSSNNKITNLTNVNKIKKSKLNIEMTAGKYGGKSIAIYSYNISIVVNGKEAYNSGSISANKKTSIKISKLLSDYVDISTNTDESKINIKVTARSIDGGVTTESKQIGFLDKKDPEGCDELVEDPPSGPEHWINVKSSRKYRTITIPCDDGDGSGCTRDEFVGTWNKQKQAKETTMKIKDNAGNETTCNVRAYVDLDPPIVTIKKKPTDSGAKDLFDKDVVKQGDSGNVINTTDYKYASSNGWVINEHYPKALNFEIVLEDNLNLVSWVYETNDTHIWKESDANNSAFHLYSNTNKDASASVTSISGKSTTIKISLGKDASGNVLEGMRKGKLTVKDEAGNETIVIIRANIDVTKPTCHGDITYSPSTANPGAHDGWLKDGEKATVYSWCEDHESGCAAHDASDKVKLTYSKDINTTTAGSIDWNNKYSGYVYDIAGNVSKACPVQTVKIDTVKPTCSVQAKDNSGAKYSSKKWINNNVTVYHGCSDSGGDTTGGSKCNNNSTLNKQQTTYSASPSRKVLNAGPVGENKPGKIEDIAGNVTDCTDTVDIYFDVDRPTCDLTAKKSGGSSYTFNTWTNENVTLTTTCHDTGGSDCADSSWHKTYYASNGTINYAGSKTGGSYSGAASSGKAVDKAGNESLNDCPIDGKIMFDTTPPTCSPKNTSSTSSWYGPDTGELWIEYECKDSESTCETAIDCGSSSSSCSGMTYSHQVSSSNSYDSGTEGFKEYGGAVKIRDKVGNEASCGGVKFKVDTVAPSCWVNSHSSTSPWYGHGDDLWIKYSCDDDGSGCASSLTCPGSTGCSGLTYSHTISRTNSYDSGTEGDQEYGGGIKIEDKVGNLSKKCGGVDFSIDTKPPKIQGLVANSWTNYDDSYYIDQTHGAKRKAVQYYLGRNNVNGKRHGAVQVWVEDHGVGISPYDDWDTYSRTSYSNGNHIICVGAEDKFGNTANPLCACFCKTDSFWNRTSESNADPFNYQDGKAYPIYDSRWYNRYAYISDSSSTNPEEFITDSNAMFDMDADECESC